MKLSIPFAILALTSGAAAGQFGPQQIISTAVDEPTSAVAADLDGDGDEDVLSASLNDDAIAWYENTDGLGTADHHHNRSEYQLGFRSGSGW